MDEVKKFDKEECAGCIYAGRPNENIHRSGEASGCLIKEEHRVEKCRTVFEKREKGDGYDLVQKPRNPKKKCDLCGSEGDLCEQGGMLVCASSKCIRVAALLIHKKSQEEKA